jgi:putative nucleotidyltransferase with HDIG domain
MSSVEEIVRQVEKLPTINTVAFQVVQMCSDLEIPIPRLIKVISGDQSLTAQILKIANSSYFNFPRTIYSLDRAIVILGFNLLKDIAVSIAIYSLYKGFNSNKYFDIQSLWKHSVYTGFALKTLAEEYDPEHKDILYIGGLLHDIGKLAFIKVLNEEYYLIYEKSKQEDAPLFEVEQTFLGYDHAMLGARLLDEWHLPEAVVDMVQYHHHPQEFQGEPTVAPWVRLVYLGNLLVHLLDAPEATVRDVVAMDSHFENYFSFSDSDIQHLLNKVRKDLDEQQDYLKLFNL